MVDRNASATNAQQRHQGAPQRIVDVRPTPQVGEHVLDDVLCLRSIADEASDQRNERSTGLREHLTDRDIIFNTERATIDRMGSDLRGSALYQR